MPDKINLKKFSDELATVVRRRRKRLRLSQEELAYRAKIDRTYVSRLECGKAGITAFVSYKISKALRTSLANLFKEVEKGL